MDTSFQVPSALGRPFSLPMYGVLSGLGKTPFVAYWIFLSKSRTVQILFLVAFYLIFLWKTSLSVSESTRGMNHFAIFQCS